MTVVELSKQFMPDKVIFDNTSIEIDYPVKSFSYDFESRIMHVVVEIPEDDDYPDEFDED